MALVWVEAGNKNSPNTVALSRILTVVTPWPPSLDTKRPKALPGAPVPSALWTAIVAAVVDYDSLANTPCTATTVQWAVEFKDAHTM